MSRKAKYASETVPFPKGASLFLYSDALIETATPNRDEIGHDGVVALLEEATATRPDDPVGALAEGFFAEIERPLRDDLTAVWVRRD